MFATHIAKAVTCIAALFVALAAALIADEGSARSRAEHQSISAQDWETYKQRFLDSTVRVIDNANGYISHSEGQGYGMLLAFYAGNRADFRLIWSFTKRHLLLRKDGLVSWKWDPNASPNVPDRNNATDGDILIAYALTLAGQSWHEPEYTATAIRFMHAVRRSAIVRHGGDALILPGISGFSAKYRGDAPIVNLSYWIFEAFHTFAEVDDRASWNSIFRDGLVVLRRAEMGPRTLPPDWLSLYRAPKPAEGFEPRFGYDALRIPLYLVRAGIVDKDLLAQLAEGMSDANGAVVLTHIKTGTVQETLTDPGYRIIPALALCVAKGTPVPNDLRSFSPTLYYPSTLHLLGLAFLSNHDGDCR